MSKGARAVALAGGESESSRRIAPTILTGVADDRARVRRVLDESMSGNVTVNDTILHIAQTGLPFGGVGASGMGQYHGEDGFHTFSKRKGVFVQSRFNNTWLLKPPFGKRVERMLRLLLR